MHRMLLVLSVFTLGMASGQFANAHSSLGPEPVPSERLARNYSEVRSFLYELSTRHPQKAQMVEIGDSDSGELIEGIRIGEGTVQNLVVAAHHGNEYGSTEVALAFARSLAENPIQGQALIIIPVLNIEGYNKRQRREVANGRSHDPNRDYPGPCGTEGPFELKSTASLARFIREQQIVASATLHTFYPAVVYPWGFATRDLSTPYDDLFIELGKAATQESGYEVGNSTQVIYPASGTYEDYAFLQHGVWSMLFELGFSHSPSDEQVEKMIAVNLPGLRRMFEVAPRERAERHEFTGECDLRLLSLDRHDE